MSDVEVSVIVPAFNAERTIARCLDSLCVQGSDDFPIEVIVVDDGSTDGTADVLAAYEAEHPFVRVVTVENGGPSRARNIGLSRAKGRWIAFCDSDDWVDPGCFRPVVELAERRGVGLAVFGYKNVRSGSTRTHARRVARVVGATELAKRCLLDPRVQGFSWNKLYLRELVARERFPEDVRFCEDLLFNIDVCERNMEVKVLLVPGAPYNYDLTGESLTRGGAVVRSVEGVLAAISENDGLASAARGVAYSNSVKTAHEMLRGGVAPCVGDFRYARDFFHSRFCPLTEKAKVALRRVLIVAASLRAAHDERGEGQDPGRGPYGEQAGHRDGRG